MQIVITTLLRIPVLLVLLQGQGSQFLMDVPILIYPALFHFLTHLHTSRQQGEAQTLDPLRPVAASRMD